MQDTATSLFQQSRNVLLLKRRDAPAFSLLYDVYVPALWGYVSKLTADSELAAAIVLKTVNTIWLDLPAYDPSRKRLLPWMLCILIQQCSAYGLQPIRMFTGSPVGALTS